jgi:hypothetical protein
MAPSGSATAAAGSSLSRRTVAYLVGAMLALAVGGSSTAVGLDRDRAFYPTILIVIASYYALFAVMGESTHALIVEAGRRWNARSVSACASF